MFEATLLEATLYGGYYVRGYFVPGPIVTALTIYQEQLEPLKHSGKEPRVNSVILEIRRDQYMII